MTLQSLFDDLIRYKKGLLSDKERAVFEKKLKKDPFLQDAYEGLNNFLETHSQKDLDQFFKESQNYLDFQSVKKRNQNSYSWFAAVASIALLIGIFLFNNLKKPSIDPFDFKEAGLNVYMNDSAPSDMAVVMNEFKMENYKEASREIDKILIKRPFSDTALYFKAAVSDAQSQYSEALSFYSKIQSDSEFFDKAQYKQAICLWKLKKYKEAKLIMKEIAQNQNHSFHKKARLFLNKM